MLRFLKNIVAIAVGFIVALILLFLIGTFWLITATSSTSSQVDIKTNSVLVISLKGELNDRQTVDPLAKLSGEDPGLGLDDLTRAIGRAKEDDHIVGILLKAGELTAGTASIGELRTALNDFKQSGKFITAYADRYQQNTYYLCSVADRVLLNPQGGIVWVGLASTPMFYKNMLAKLGIEMQVFKVGTYKSAVEPYTSTQMSEANREQVTHLLQGMWAKMTADVAESRGLTVEQVNAAAERVPLLRAASESVQMGLADTLLYRIDLEDYLKQQAGIDKDDKLHTVSVDDVINAGGKTIKDRSGDVIAVYYASGTIVENQDNYSPIYGSGPYIVGNEVAGDLLDLRDDDKVKAVVFRVNSPGGSAFASEQIWNAVSELKKKKPVIVSMGDYAASGGYYISCNADVIVSNENTLTGSIGIFGLYPNLQKTAEMVGLDFDVVKTNTYSDFGAFYRPMNEGEKQIMQSYIEEGYDTFLTRCSDGRNIDKDELNKIAQGRVWSGTDAVGLGLVDEIGDLHRAIGIAAERAGLDDYTLKDFPVQRSVWESLIEALNELAEAKAMSRVGSIGRQLMLLKSMAEDDHIQALMPYQIINDR